VPDMSFGLVAAVPLPRVPSPLGERLAGADVALPRSALPWRFWSQAPKAKAPITATAPMMSLFDMVLSRSMASALGEG